MATQLTVFVTFWIHPDKVDDFKAAHRPVWVAIAAEPANILFDVFRADPTPSHTEPEEPPEAVKFRLVEVWQGNQAWFEQEQLGKKPYYDDLWPKSRPTWARECRIEYFEREGEGFSWDATYLSGGRLDPE